MLYLLLVKHDEDIATIVDANTELTLLICKSEREAVTRICEDHAIDRALTTSAIVSTRTRTPLRSPSSPSSPSPLSPPSSSTSSRSSYDGDHIDEEELARLDSSPAKTREPRSISDDDHTKDHSNDGETRATVSSSNACEVRIQPRLETPPSRHDDIPHSETSIDQVSDPLHNANTKTIDVEVDMDVEVDTGVAEDMSVREMIDPVNSSVESVEVIMENERMEGENEGNEARITDGTDGERFETEDGLGNDEERFGTGSPPSSDAARRQHRPLEMKVTSRNRRRLAERRRKEIMKKSATAKALFDERCRARRATVRRSRRGANEDMNDEDDDAHHDMNDDETDDHRPDPDICINDDADNEATPAPPDVSRRSASRRSTSRESRETMPAAGSLRSPTIELGPGSDLRSDPRWSSLPSMSHISQQTGSSGESDETMSPTDVDRDWLSARLATSDSVKARDTPINMQEKMIRSAYLIGGPKVMQDWQVIYQYWRDNGTLHMGIDGDEPLSHFNPDMLYERNPQLRNIKPALLSLHFAWHRVQRLEVNSLLHAIWRRQRLAELSDAYDEASSTVEFSTHTGDRSALAQAKRKLFVFLHPRWSDIPNPASNPATRQAYKKFDHIIAWSRRWSHISKTLGLGVLALIPESLITNRFVEQDLVLDQFHAWVALIQRVNPDCVRLGETFLTRIQTALQGEPISRKRLRIETVAKADIRHTRDMSTLLEEVNEGQVTSGDEPELIGWGEMD